VRRTRFERVLRFEPLRRNDPRLSRRSRLLPQSFPSPPIKNRCARVATKVMVWRDQSLVVLPLMSRSWMPERPSAARSERTGFLKAMMKLMRWLAVAAVVLAPAAAQGQAIKPRFLIIVDTSGSMSLGWYDDPNDTPDQGRVAKETHGDGSARHPGCDLDGNGLYDDSRLAQAKKSLRDTIAAFGQAEFALARYKAVDVQKICTTDTDCTGDATLLAGFGALNAQGQMNNLECIDPTHITGTATYCAVNRGWGCDTGYPGLSESYCYDECDTFSPALTTADLLLCERCAAPQSDPTDVYVKGIECSGGTGCAFDVCDGADVIVPFPSNDSNFAELMSWIDGVETYPAGTNPELRANGSTPLAGSLTAAYNWLTEESRTDIGLRPGPIATDPQASCRDYSVILITDGVEKCDADTGAVAAAAKLFGAEIKTFVIGFNAQGTSLDAIAEAGQGPGSGATALLATDETELTARLGDIVAGSIPPPVCDCDSTCDDESVAFPDKASQCAVGVGRCKRFGVFGCTADGSGTVCAAPPGDSGDPVCGLTPLVPGPANTGDACDPLTNCPPGLTAEECSDTDCDGDIDETVGCQCAAKPELCNGLDDNCDGMTDENIASVSCGLDVGECEAGTTACIDDGGKKIVCQDAVGPTNELCDALDNDCDGVTDGFGEACFPASTLGCSFNIVDQTWACQGACQTGIQICPANPAGTTNDFGACNGAVVPREELACDGVDNDCDGDIDEGFGIGDSCYPQGFSGCGDGTGPCVGACGLGTLQCESGAVVCKNATTPTAELCDGIDNDCDGFTDTQLGACGSGLGECQPGTFVCDNGEKICNQPMGPQDEVCDGKDNDCDGAIDNNLTEPEFATETPCSTNEGICRQGVLKCIAGAPFCLGGIEPQIEVCNNLDDDCDGCTDCDTPCLLSKGKMTCPIAGSGQACGLAVGACMPGQLLCVAGATMCVGATSPGTELCDGIDNDCNGFTDEADPRLAQPCYPDSTQGCDISAEVCEGECAFGTLVCHGSGGAAELECTNAVTPEPEACDGKDNNCNGVVDEGFDLGAACDNGASGGCFEAGQKICNARGDGTTCSAAPPPISEEICDGKDNDCDGAIDSLDTDAPLPGVGASCGSSVGECATGVQECVDGEIVCSDVGPTPEICDGKDNNCNGSVDEGLVPPAAQCAPDGLAPDAPIVGECRPGVFVCGPDAQGEHGWLCQQGVGPTPEVCDGKDNDCDGAIDDNAPCTGDAICRDGECIEPCRGDEFPCKPGRQCEDGYCIRSKCAGVRCEAGFVCNTDGTCVDQCADITCPGNSRCLEGRCVDCNFTGCGTGEICKDQLCQPDPCAGVTCEGGQVCRAGACIGSCAAVECPAGTTCKAGVCETDLCAQTQCAGRQFCDPATGACRDNGCPPVCPIGTACIATNGRCESDPCLELQCSPGDRCVVFADGDAQCYPPPANGPIESDNREDSTTGGGGLFSCALVDPHNTPTPPWLLLLAVFATWGLNRRRAIQKRAQRTGAGPGDSGRLS